MLFDVLDIREILALALALALSLLTVRGLRYRNFRLNLRIEHRHVGRLLRRCGRFLVHGREIELDPQALPVRQVRDIWQVFAVDSEDRKRALRVSYLSTIALVGVGLFLGVDPGTLMQVVQTTIF